MRNLLKFDLKFDREIAVLTILSTLMIMVDRYHNFTGYKALDRIFIYLILPLAIIMLVERKSPRDYGFRLGDWKAGIALTILVIGISIPILWYITQGSPQMQEYYKDQLSPATPLFSFLDLIGWEFTFRGWLLFGYARKYGPEALWLQAVPFALGHLGKPEVETLSTIFGGFLFGLVAWRTHSFLYPFLIHWFINTFVVLVAGGAF